jgi:ABC-type branched-subunit amino acid transport system ATPase component
VSRPSKLGEAFSPEARRRAAEFVAARGAQGRVPLARRNGNGHGRGRPLEIDLTKLERFAGGRARVAEQLAAGGGALPRRRAERREILTVDNLSIRFGGVQALNGMTLTARTGEVGGVIGPNGAGKTTFFNCLSGLLTPDSGQLMFNGKPLKGAPAARSRRGLGRTFQTPRLFRSLSVRENLIFGCRTADSAKLPYVFDSSLRRLPHDERAEKVARMVGFTGDLSAPTGSLPFGDLRTVELARALCGAPSLLMLDEPASGLDVDQAEAFVGLLRSLSDLGLAILLIEHDMGLVMDVCEHLTVLDFGQVIAEGTPEQVQANEMVIEAYLGRSG